jgi:uncharacterized membrane protein YhfC
MVSWFSIFIMIFNMILGAAVPIGLMLYLRKKYHISVLPFWIGCAVMVLFALVLEQIIHFVFLQSPAGSVVQNNTILLALYGGLMAGLFEEGGRFLAMKYVMKKSHTNPHNALMYGAGHGGIEMFVILVFGMINNVIYSLLLNIGQAELLLAPLDQAGRNAVQDALEASPLLFLASPAERLFAITGQMALSVIVWFAAVKKEKWGLLPLAVLLHLILDASAVLMAKAGAPILLIEAEVLAVVVLIVLCARTIWKRESLS